MAWRVLLFVLGVSWAGSASAVTYALEDIAYNGAAQTAGFGIALPPVSLTISRSAVMSGHFDFHARPGPAVVTGDVAQMIQFQVGSTTIQLNGSGGLYGYLDISLAFDVFGNVTRSAIDWLGPANSFDLAGTGTTITGAFSPSDSSLCGYNGSPAYDCRLTAQLLDPPDPVADPVPEPGAGLIGASALALYGLSRRLALMRLWPRAGGR